MIENVISVPDNNCKSAVMVDGNLSDLIKAKMGLCRGVLAPFLFTMLIDYLMKRVIEDTNSGIVTHNHQSRRRRPSF